MRLSSLNPVSLLFGPVFQKEVRTSGRKRGTYVLRCLYGVLLLGIVAIAFSQIQSMTSHFSGVARLQRLQQMAPVMALAVSWFQFVALCMAAPILTGPVICDEKRARTLPALMTTPLTAAQVVLGSLSSRVVQLMILALIATPLLLAIRVFGGLDARFVLGSTCVALSAAFLGAALGLMFSAWHKRGATAAIFALMTLVLLMGAPTIVEWIICGLLNETTFGPTRAAAYPFHMDVLATCSPATMAFLSQSAMMGTDPGSVELSFITTGYVNVGGKSLAMHPQVPTWALNSVYNLVLAGLVTVYTTNALRRIMLREAAGSTEAPGAAPRKKKQKKGTPEPVEASGGDETVREAARQREVSDRPVLWRELRQNAFGSRKWVRVIGVLTVLGLLTVYWLTARLSEDYSLTGVMGNDGLHMTLMVIGAIAIMIQPVFMATGSIAGEREARSWEVLLTTPLTGRQIILGKFAGALRVQWFMPAVVLVHILIATFSGFVNPLFILHIVLIYLGPTLLFSATGQLFSLTFRRAVTAAVCNLVLAMCLWLGMWIALGLVTWFTNRDGGRMLELVSNCLYCLNPVALAVSAGEPAFHHGHGWLSDSYVISGFKDEHLPAWAFTAVVMSVFAFYLTGTVLTLWIAIVRFRGLSGRSS